MTATARLVLTAVLLAMTTTAAFLLTVAIGAPLDEPAYPADEQIATLAAIGMWAVVGGCLLALAAVLVELTLPRTPRTAIPAAEIIRRNPLTPTPKDTDQP